MPRPEAVTLLKPHTTSESVFHMTESWRFPQILGMKFVAVTQPRVQYVLPIFACIYLQQPLLTTLITTPLQRLLMIHSMGLEFLYFSILLQKTLEQQEHLLIFHMQYPVQSRCVNYQKLIQKLHQLLPQRSIFKFKPPPLTYNLMEVSLTAVLKMSSNGSRTPAMLYVIMKD